MSEISYVHAYCGGEIVFEPDVENPYRTNHVCAKCRKYVGFFIDGGTLDLADIQLNVLNSENDYTIYP